MSSGKPWWAVAVAVTVTALAIYNGWNNVGWIVAVILGGSAIGGLIMWLLTTFHRPAEPTFILPVYILTLAMLKLHIVEEYAAGFPEAMAETFHIHLTEHQFVLEIGLGLWVLWLLAGFGLAFRNPLANFIAWFMFVGMIVGEPTHFWFPSQSPEHGFYFPGMATALLPTIPALYGAVYLVRHHWFGGKTGESTAVTGAPQPGVG